MAQTIKLKRSGTQNAVPTTSQLALGEVALNTYDGKMYIKKSVGGTESIVEIGGDATSSSGLDFTGNLNLEDNVRIVIGDGNDLQIYHDGSDSIINENGTGDLKVFSSRFRVISSAGEEMIRATADGAVDLYHNNSKKFETTSGGIQVQGAMAATTGAYSPIYYGGSSSLQLKSNNGEMFAQFTNNGAAELYYDNALKLATTSTGATVTGTLVADGLDLGDDNILNVGTIAVDKVKGDADDNTNITFAGNDITAFYQGGAEKIRIDADGRLLVNTTSSIDNFAKIQVVGDSSSLARITLQDVDGTNQKTYFEQSGGGTRINTQNGTSNGFFTIGAWDGTTSSDFVRVDSSGNVGIGTASPLAKLDVRGDIELNSTYPVIRFKDSDSENDFSIIGGSGLFRIYDEDATSSRISVTSAGNVGIGTDSPAQKLSVNGNIYSIGGFVNASGYQLNGTYVVDSSRNLVNIGTVTASGIVNIGGGTSYFSEKLLVQGRTRVAGQLDIAAGTGYGNYAKFTHDDTELEIATVRSAGTNGQIVLSPLGTAALTLDTSQNATFAGNITMTGNQLKIISSTDSNLGWMIRDNTYVTDEMDITSTRLGTGNQPTLGLAGQNGINFYVAGTNVGSFNSSGHLLVGKSSTGVNTNGIEARTDGLLAASRDQNPALYVTRTTDAGDIAKFYSGTTSVGSIGTINNILTIGSGSTGIIFNPNASPNASIYPWNVGTNSASDSAIDLGISTRRWQDLYLSGTIYGGSTLTLDPAAHGDDTGTVVIAGNLQVDGTTTTINSTTLTVDDKNITLASGSTNAAAANGAGITVDCGSGTDATFTYISATDDWRFNKPTRVSGLTNAGIAFSSTETLVDGSSSLPNGRIFYHSSHLIYDSPSSGHRFAVAGNQGTNIAMVIDSGQRVGIGTTAPTARLHLSTGTETPLIAVATAGYFASTFTTPYDYVSKFESTDAGAHVIIEDSNSTNNGNSVSVYGNEMRFMTNSAYHMYISSTGNVGIGTATPTSKLHITGNQFNTGQIRANTGTAANPNFTIDGGAGMFKPTSNVVGFSTNSTERLRIASGNPYVFLGHTGHSWGTFDAVAQIGRTGFIANYDGGANQQTVIANNTYYGGSGYTSIESATGAAYINLNQGKVDFFTAPSTTAGATQTFTKRFSISAGGAATFNEEFTFPTSDGSGNQVLQTDGSGNVSWATISGVGAPTYMEDADGDTKIQVEESADEDIIRFDTAGSQRMVIDSGGNFGFGVDTPSNYFHVKKNSAGIIARIEGTSGRYIYTGTDSGGHYLEQVGTSAAERIFRIQSSNGSSTYTVLSLDGHNQRIYTDAGAKFGIGTTPSYKLHVNDTQGDVAYISSSDPDGNGATNGRVLHVRDNYATTSLDSYVSAGWTSSPGQDVYIGKRTTSGAGYLAIKNSSGTEHFTINMSSGNVGIGTTSPGVELDIKRHTNPYPLRIGSSQGEGRVIVYADVNTSPTKYNWIAGTQYNINDGYEITPSTAVGGYTFSNPAIVVLSNRNVGIGTTSPGRKLTVQGASGDNLPLRVIGGSGTNHGSMEFQDPNTTADYKVTIGSKTDDFYIQAGGTEKVRVLANGNVGIGTTAPRHKLSVNGTLGSSTFSGFGLGVIGGMATAESATPNAAIGMQAASASSSKIFAYDYSGSAGIPISIQPDNADVYLSASGGNVGIGTDSPASTLHVQNTSTNSEVMRLTTTGDNPDRHMYFQSDHIYSNGQLHLGDGGQTNQYRANIHKFMYGTSNTEAMRIDSSGRVGIGTTSPGSKLSIHSALADYATTHPSATNSTLELRDTRALAAGNGASIVLTGTYTSGGSHLGNAPYIKAYKVNSTDGNYSFGLKFATRKNGVSAQTVAMTIDDEQRVGIGTTSPSQKLDVEGLIRSGGIAHPEIELVPTGSVGNADIRFDGTSLDIRSNSSGAYLTLQTSTTERLKITNTGNFEFNNGNFTEVGSISSGAITVNGGIYQSVIKSSSDAPLIVESTDAYSGINFKDPDGNSSMFYRGSNDFLYLNSAKFSVAGATLATGYQFQVNGSANLTGSLAIGGTTAIDSSRNITAGTISSGAITATKSSSHTTGTISHSNAALDLYNSLESDTDEKGSIITFTDNYYDGSNYIKTTRAAIKGGTDTTGNTANGFLAFYTDSNSANTANERMRIDFNGNFDFKSGNFSNVGTISSGAISTSGTINGSQNQNAGYIHKLTNTNTGTSAYTEFTVESGTQELRIGTSQNYSDGQWDGSWIYAAAGDLFLKSENAHVKMYAGGSVTPKWTFNTDGSIRQGDYNGSTFVDSSRNITAGTISSGNITTTGYLRGPSTFTIDPATHGDDTGTVVIAGNLQVDGTTTTINSTTLTVDDLNITLASGSANSAAANGAGITVDIANNTNPTLLYNGTLDTWEFNKRVDVTSEVRLFRSDGTRSGSILHNTSGTVVRTNSNGDNLYLQAAGTGNVYIQPTQAGYSTVINEDGIDSDFRVESDGNTHAFFVDAGNSRIGINTSGLTADGLVIGTNNNNCELDLHNTSTNGSRWRLNSSAQGHFTIENKTEATTDFSILDTSGNVGVGIASPVYRFHAYHPTTNVVARFESGDGQVWMDLHDSNSGTYGALLGHDGSAGQLFMVADQGVNRRFIIDTSGQVSIGTNVNPVARLQVEELGIDTTTTSTTATTQVAIDTFAAATFRSARYTIQVTNSTDSTYHLTEILLIHDGTTPQITEYGTIFTGSAEATFDADISSGNVRLLATPATTDSMTFKVVRHCITV